MGPGGELVSTGESRVGLDLLAHCALPAEQTLDPSIGQAPKGGLRSVLNRVAAKPLPYKCCSIGRAL